MRIWMVVLTAAACGSGHTAKPDAAPTLTIYLNFEGATIEPATAGSDDAATNLSSIVTTEKIVPPYLDGVSTRDATIASIVSSTKARFAPFDTAIVTERPTSLAYFMIVFTGQPAVVLGPGTTGVSAITTFPCPGAPGQPNLNSIAFQFQDGTTTDSYMPVGRGNMAIPLVALAQGIAPTTPANDCLCFASNSCTILTAACTIGGPSTPVDTAHACTGAPTTEDEMSLLVGLFGAAH